jgi:hypothetical protein
MFALPGDDVVTASPDCPLRLELSGPIPPLVAGSKVTIPFVVRNVSNAGVESCTIDRPSIRIRSESDRAWRIVMIAGMTSDTDCSRRIHLGPGATESFAQEMVVFSNLPEGAATIDAILAFDRGGIDKDGCGEALSWRRMVSILRSPP